MTNNSAKMMKQEFETQLQQECNITEKGIVIDNDGSLEINPDTLRKNAELRKAKGAEIARRNMSAMVEQENERRNHWNNLFAKAIASDNEKRKAETEKANAEIIARVESENGTHTDPLSRSLLELAKGLHK